MEKLTLGYNRYTLQTLCIKCWDLVKFHYFADTTENWLITTVNTAYLSFGCFGFSSFSLLPTPPAPLSSSGAPGLSSSSGWGWLGCSAGPVSSSSSPEQSPRGKKIGDCRVGERTETSTPNFSGFDEVFSEYFPSSSLLVFWVCFWLQLRQGRREFFLLDDCSWWGHTHSHCSRRFLLFQNSLSFEVNMLWGGLGGGNAWNTTHTLCFFSRKNTCVQFRWGVRGLCLLAWDYCGNTMQMQCNCLLLLLFFFSWARKTFFQCRWGVRGLCLLALDFSIVVTGFLLLIVKVFLVEKQQDMSYTKQWPSSSSSSSSTATIWFACSVSHLQYKRINVAECRILRTPW